MIVPTNIDFEDYLRVIGEQESQEILPASAFSEEVIDLCLNGEVLIGDMLPWAKTHNSVRLRMGEVSIWGGINGHKKSMILGMVMIWLARTTPICIASLEMKPKKTLQRMYTQAAGCNPSREFIHHLDSALHDKIFIYDQLDTVESIKILGMVHYAAVELGCKHIVIDSLMKCGIDTEDHKRQKAFVDRLCWAAKRHDVHIHLVAHVRKGINEQDRPGKFDISGTGDITNLVDNVFICWMDKKREQIGQKIDRGLTIEQEDQDYYENTCDQVLIVPKQRDGSWEGTFRLWFHDKSLQFTPTIDNRVMPYQI